MNICNLLQYNSVVNDSHGRILDLVFSNSNLTVNACSSSLVPEDPHHRALTTIAEFVQLHTIKPRSFVRYFYHDGDFTSICSNLDAIDWHFEIGSRSIEDALSFLYNTIYTLRDRYVTSKLVTPSRKYPLWYKRPLIKMIREKAKYHNKYKKYGNSYDRDSFILLRDRVRIMEQSMYNTYIKNIENSIKKDPRAFWSYVKSKNNSNSYPAVLEYGTRSSDQGDEICNFFSEYFYSTFLDNRQASGQPTPSSTYPSDCSSTADIGEIEVLERNVFNLLKTLDLNKSAGPDNIPAIFIVNCAKSLVVPLSLLYRRSLTEGIVPSIWKTAFITPIHKKGPKNRVENYRPISKLCLFAKILEKIVYGQLYSAIKHDFLQQQHGFLRGRSTTSNLLLCVDYLTQYMSIPSQVDIIYTDYSKCFDRIDHLVLLEKLKRIGIRGNLFRWFSSYVQNRCQTVVLSGYSSSPMCIPSGVPQGSLLGPLLFNIFINDISSCFIYSKILLYADDMKILHSVKNADDAHHLQDDLNRFQNYCILNKLDLNVSKCYVCSFTRKPTKLIFNYTLLNLPLTRVDKIKDLGVIFDSKLLFDEHINNIVKKASRALGFVFRMSSEFKSVKTFKILYCSYVRSHLEYASQVWNPHYGTYTSRIESIQRKFLHYLQYRARIFLPNYKVRCKKFHLLPLFERRYSADLNYLLNVANGSVDCPDLLAQLQLRTNVAALREPDTLHVPFARTNYRQNSFMIRASKSFNNLLKTNKDIDLFNTAASKLKRIINNKFFGSNDKTGSCAVAVKH
ncbi:hypothetical protein ABMA27_001603 [Loxostege sticticalis]|uniref:Reverse transcriptase domain-containing protein n=1 Tax=Loxostege sticticalis TaxID=481309 RepID=A0ABR3HZ28_LOXSC